MSVASVLERSGNVRDVDEVYLSMHAPVWEKIPEEAILDGIASSWTHLPFLIDNIYKFDNSKQISNYFNELAFVNNLNLTNDIDLKKLKLNIFLSQKANARIYAGDLSKDLNDSEVLKLGKDVIQNIIKTNYRRGFNLSENLDFIFWYKACFPSEEIRPALESLYLNHQINLNRLDFQTDDQITVRLRGLAIIKILCPEVLDDLNIQNTDLFLDGIQRAQDALDMGGKLIDNAIGLCAYLKVLSAEKAVLGPRGIELTMPKSLALPSSPTLPEIGRFDV